MSHSDHKFLQECFYSASEPTALPNQTHPQGCVISLSVFKHICLFVIISASVCLSLTLKSTAAVVMMRQSESNDMLLNTTNVCLTFFSFLSLVHTQMCIARGVPRDVQNEGLEWGTRLKESLISVWNAKHMTLHTLIWNHISKWRFVTEKNK